MSCQMPFPSQSVPRPRVWFAMGIAALLGACASINQDPMAQPVIGAKTKGILNIDGLQFKDSNGNGRLDPYEDWRLPVDERGMYGYMADLATEPRWYRVQETFTEDADLNARIVTALVEGLQGGPVNPGSAVGYVNSDTGIINARA